MEAAEMACVLKARSTTQLPSRVVLGRQRVVFEAQRPRETHEARPRGVRRNELDHPRANGCEDDVAHAAAVRADYHCSVA